MQDYSAVADKTRIFTTTSLQESNIKLMGI